MNSPEEIQNALAKTWEQFKGKILERVKTLEEVAAAAAEDLLTPEARERGAREAHKLAGALGTFGFHEGTRLAREAELLLQGDGPLEEAQRLRLSRLVPALRRELARPRA